MSVFGVFRFVRWVLALVGVVALVLCGMLATPVKSLPPLASIHAGARAIGRQESRNSAVSKHTTALGSPIASMPLTMVRAIGLRSSCLDPRPRRTKTHRDRLAAIPSGDGFRQCA
jgi:hypothetical protein